jgi:small-conductance mechanosensitive channel/CRP-like cAMP-binding protein
VPLDALIQMQSVLSGLGLGLLVVLVVLVLLPSGERRLVRGPLILLFIYAATRGTMSLIPAGQFPTKLLHFVAVFAWCAAIVRSLFVLFASARLQRVLGKPWPKIMRDVVQAVLYVVVALIALRAIGLEPGQLLTTSALLTAILGFSMQDTLGNLFAGLALQGQQTVGVGDWVRFADGPEGIGEVTEINWRATHFLTNDRVQVIVPNGVLARAVVRNFSRPTRIVREETEVVFPYSVSPERARTLALGAIRGLDGILEEPEAHVLILGVNDIGVRYGVRWFLNDYSRRDPIDSAVRQRVLYALRRADIAVPVPHRAVTLASPSGSPPAGTHFSEPPPREGTQNYAERLARFDLFKPLSPAQLAHLAEGARTALYAPGEAIIRQGDPGTELFAVERGRVEVVVALDNRPPLRVALLEPGAVVGELALLTGEKRTATVQALAECEVIVVSRGAFKEVFDANPELVERLTERLAQRMDQLNQAVSDATDGAADGERRSDILMQRIRKFFSG